MKGFFILMNWILDFFNIYQKKGNILKQELI
jgi:hypothetical protein